MTDIVNEAFDFLESHIEEQTDSVILHNDLHVISDYIDYLENLVLACSDCIYGYTEKDLRIDFQKDIYNG